jgi:hypothetical protein
MARGPGRVTDRKRAKGLSLVSVSIMFAMGDQACATLEETHAKEPGAATADPEWGARPRSRGGEKCFARQVDAELARLARGRGAIDLALGDALLVLFEGDRLQRLGYARRKDYARERLGVSPRLMFSWLELARELRSRPILRRAVIAGVVTRRKALLVAPVASGDAELAWTAAAMACSCADLELRVREAGAAPGLDALESETLVLRMTVAQQDRLDAALQLAREILGADRARWECLEAVAMEWLGEFGAWAPGDQAGGENASVKGTPVEEPLSASERLLAAIEGVEEEGPRAWEPADLEPRALDERVRGLMQEREGFDEPFGRLARVMADRRLYRNLGYGSFGIYCEERLGLAERTVRERIWLERRMEVLPAIREALVARRLSYAKALLVARVATDEDVEARIEAASTTTWQQTDREGTQEEDRRSRALGVRRLWGPKDAMETVARAIAGVQGRAEAEGERIEAGEALARMADHFAEVWGEEARRGRRGMPAARRRVLERHGGLCAVPGCSRAAEHVHHVTFLSRGGSDEETNVTPLCAVHHLRGVHQGYLEVDGQAGVRLVWKFGMEEREPLEIWETVGDDDVRRVG